MEKLKNAGLNLTPLQIREYEAASLHCHFADEGDYPYGTVFSETGERQVICKCTKISCRLFKECRSDFDPNELHVKDENNVYRPKTAEIDASLSDRRETEGIPKQGDMVAATEVLKAKTYIRVDLEPDTILEGPSNGEPEDKPISMPEVADRNTPFEQHDATFSSFVDIEQEETIHLPVKERTIVNAGPGTGKTYTLIEKLKYMLSDLETEPSNILVLCFSKVAVEVIKSRLEDAANHEELPLNWHQVDVRTFDSFATYLLAWVQENIPSLLPEHYTLECQNYDERIRMAARILVTQKDLLDMYEHIIVDEVQDLVGVRAELVLSLLHGLSERCGFTLLGDSCQSLYDYLAVNDSSVMSSDQFYKKLFHEYRDANFFSLSHNYRQGDELGELSVPYRKAILSGDVASRTTEAKKLDAVLATSDINLKNITTKEVITFLKEGTLGILSRTNGQALQISSWLRAQGIRHTFQRSAQSHDLAVWIARTLVNAETDVIDKSEFGNLFARYYPAKAEFAGKYWDALISTQRYQSKNHYEIEDLLRGVFQNARNPLLFEEPDNVPTTVTVSNIHRAKGREFDSVLILQDVLENMTDEEKCDLLEHKVCYVALTRPKKKVEKILLKPQYIYISKDEARRCFKAGGFRSKKYLSHFEVGEGSDFDTRSFARSPEIQEYIQSMKPGTRLKLLKCPEETKSYVLYSVAPEDDDRTILCYTTPTFAKSMERAIQRIFSNSHSIAYKYYPNVFGEIYIDGLTTCISSSDIGVDGAKMYGGMYIWYGLSISGFAQMEKDRY
ncbi:MAG: ATP-dependent helicase [Synergistes sp.]|nr:ATP-dependent helicase [Synergistes sp.]